MLRPPPNPRQRKHHTIFGSAPKTAIADARKKLLSGMARGMMRTYKRTREGHKITRADVDVFDALLFMFHRQANQQVYPSYDLLAERTALSRRAVAYAIKRLEAAGLLTYTRRLKRKRIEPTDKHGRPRNPIVPVRDSNAYFFADPEKLPKCTFCTVKRSSQNQRANNPPETPNHIPEAAKPQATARPQEAPGRPNQPLRLQTTPHDEKAASDLLEALGKWHEGIRLSDEAKRSLFHRNEARHERK